MKLINKIHFKNLKGDLFGGLTAAIVALPMALAFGVASGAGAIAGLYCAVFLGFFASLFGGTPSLISNPTGPMTVVMTAVVMRFVDMYGPEQGLAIAFTVVMMAGVFQILFGVMKLGQFITLMPYTVISGFMSGIGLIMILLQLAPFLGQKNEGGILGAIKNLPTYISNANSAAIILGVITLLIVFLWPNKLKKYVPSQLIALIVGTGISLLVFPESGLQIIGEIPTGLPSLQMPAFDASQIEEMLINAVMLAMLGAIDTLLTSVIADSITQTQHDSDKELIGQGIGNLISGVCGGLPGAGATMGMMVNVQAGGRSVISGMFHSLILLVIILGAAPLTQPIPYAVLAGILIKVGIDIIDWSYIKRVHKLSLKAAGIMYGVMLLTVLVDLIVAVGIGVFIANILTIQKLANIQAKKVKLISNLDDLEEAENLELDSEEKILLKKAQGQILVVHLGGAMSFGAAKAISQRRAILQDYKSLILDVTDVPLLGVTATLALESMIEKARQKNLDIFVVGASGKIQKRLEKFDILNLIPEDHQTSDLVEALNRSLTIINNEQKSLNAPTVGV